MAALGKKDKLCLHVPDELTYRGQNEIVDDFPSL